MCLTQRCVEGIRSCLIFLFLAMIWVVDQFQSKYVFWGRKLGKVKCLSSGEAFLLGRARMCFHDNELVFLMVKCG